MSNDHERRIAQLEKDVAELKAALARDKDKAWLSTVGAFADNPAYDEMVRLGRNWRRRQPKDGGTYAGARQRSSERDRSKKPRRRRSHQQVGGD